MRLRRRDDEHDALEPRRRRMPGSRRAALRDLNKVAIFAVKRRPATLKDVDMRVVRAEMRAQRSLEGVERDRVSTDVEVGRSNEAVPAPAAPLLIGVANFLGVPKQDRLVEEQPERAVVAIGAPKGCSLDQKNQWIILANPLDRPV